MPYRVDYLAGLLVVGALIGWAVGRRAPERTARGYYVVSVAAVAARAAGTFAYAIFGFMPVTITAWAIARDANNVIVGALLGLAMRDRAVLREPALLRALSVSTGLWFIAGGITSSFASDSMTQFFVQSGYAPAFFKLIVTVEVLGGAALLLPQAVALGCAMLMIDMLGAIETHAHNGDGIHADMDAIAILIRLVIIAALWLITWRPALPPRRAIALVAAGSAVCLTIAITGAHVVRALSTVVPAATSP